ncbi:MAG: hypothetical protein ACOY33_03565 [Pseudomonadota bacterium]
MTKWPLSRLALSAALASSLGISGCDVSDAPEERQTSQIAYGGCGVIDSISGDCLVITGEPNPTGAGVPDTFTPGTYPRFNPAAGDIPLNTDLPFSGSTDGTAAVSGTGTVQNALNDLDGWSTNAPFDIAMSAAIDPATVNPSLIGQNVFLLPLETVSGGDALDPADIDTAAPFNSATVAATQYTVSVASVDGGTDNTIRIKPTTPLLPKKKYLVVITNGIEDATAAPIGKAPVYDLVASEQQLVSTQLQPLRDAVQGWQALAVGYLQSRNATLNSTFSLSLPTDAATLTHSLALTFTFTTSDPVTPLVAMGGPRAALFAAGGNNPSSFTGINNADAAGLLSSPKPRTVAFPAPNAGNAFDLGTLSGGALAASRATLYTGSIDLPYYLTEPASAGDFTVLGKFWTGDTALATAFSLPVPADNDSTYNVTYRFPFAARTSDVTVPVQVTLPNPAHAPASFGGATCSMAYAASGYPVAIYVHGITSDRSSVLALAHSLASNACIATVAIDLPMHGIPATNALWRYLNVDRADLTTVAADNPSADERHFEIATTGTAPAAMNFSSPTALDGSGSWFINLANLQNSRDNMRQAVMDLLNLNASLTNINALDLDGDANAANDNFDLSKVTVVGVSLGGIIATTFATVNQAVIANETAVNTAAGVTVFPIRLNGVKALATSSAGGQLTRVLENSLSFGPRILGGLAAAGATPGTSNYEKFLYTAQSTVDSGDPVNFAQTLSAMGVKLLTQEVIGGGDASVLGTANDTTTYLADKVVPNNANAPVTINYGLGSYTTDTAPLAGTDPLATLLGVSKLSAGFTPGNQAVGTPGVWLPQTLGHHASLLRPYESAAPSKCGEYAATYEMQTQAVSFLASLGAGVAVGVASLASDPPDAAGCTFSAGETAAFVGTN